MKKKYVKPSMRPLKVEVECHQYWHSGWRNDKGEIEKDNDDSYHKSDDQYYKRGWGQAKSSIWDSEED